MSKVIMFPGQGSQYRGMGKSLFAKYRQETSHASDLLGYDIEELCVSDPNKQLAKTQFTQPALFVVNAFTYWHHVDKQLPDYFIGHSLGEYNALLAAEAFDFETGLKLVRKRGELMAAASGGGMAAVLGIDIDTLRLKLNESGYTDIDVANYNTPTQTVIAGLSSTIHRVVKDFEGQGIKIIPLAVTAPFHSRYMKPVAEEFSQFLQRFSFNPLCTSVISNVTAQPYGPDVASLLSEQVASPVRWTDTIRWLMGREVGSYEEIGSMILSNMVKEIKVSCTPIVEEPKDLDIGKPDAASPKTNGVTSNPLATSSDGPIQKANPASGLGSRAFREAYGIKYAYVAGAMYRGIASKEFVVLMGKANLLAFLGTGGLSLEEIRANINYIQQHLSDNEAYGMNLLHNLNHPEFELDTVRLYLETGVTKIEASAYMQITPSLVHYRLKGLYKDANGNIQCKHQIMAKISRPEVAEAFMRPAPENLVKKLLEQGLVTAEQATMSSGIPMSYDICVEADSGGHTDGGFALALLPSIQSLRSSIEKEFSYKEGIRIGLAGGIGTPQAVACAFMMRADFVLTGSINQCTVESGISEAAKDLLQEINVQDTDYAPAGDMFEIGARVQVLKRGVLFPARANKLYSLYQQYDAVEDIPARTIAQLEKSYFKKSLNEIWEETKNHFNSKGQQSILSNAEKHPKQKMALIFRWYFWHSSRMSFVGDSKEKVNFQIHTGPALGAFNQWVKGTPLESWRNRHADQIATKLMEGAAGIMKDNLTNIFQD